MAIHAVVTFLANKGDLQGVDKDFRKLVEIFHRIPFCASFGVSCSGHFQEMNYADRMEPHAFYPSPWGHLVIIIARDMPHIQELLCILKQNISGYTDASFGKIEHVFGPPKDSRLQVWEIRISDNGCLGKFKIGKTWCGCSLLKKGNETEYENSKARYKEIQFFWKDLEKILLLFCRKHRFRRFALKKRIKEITDIWREEIKKR